MLPILEAILFHLSGDDVKNVKLISKSWRAVVLGGETKIWKNRPFQQKFDKDALTWERLSDLAKVVNCNLSLPENIGKLYGATDYALNELKRNWGSVDFSITGKTNDDSTTIATNDKYLMRVHEGIATVWERHSLKQIACFKVPIRGDISRTDCALHWDQIVFASSAACAGEVVIIPIRDPSNVKRVPLRNKYQNMKNFSISIHIDCMLFVIFRSMTQANLMIFKFSPDGMDLMVSPTDETHVAVMKFSLKKEEPRHVYFDERFIVFCLAMEEGIRLVVWSNSHHRKDPVWKSTNFEVKDVTRSLIAYQRGFLVVASASLPQIRIVDGITSCCNRNPKSPTKCLTSAHDIDFYDFGLAMPSLIAVSYKYVAFCSAFHPPKCGSLIYLWDLQEAVSSPKIAPLHPKHMFKAFSGWGHHLFVNDFCLVAVVQNEKDEEMKGHLLKGIDLSFSMQTLNFLRSCSFCHRLIRRLERCSRCRSAKYCILQCQRSHCKELCFQLAMIELVNVIDSTV